LYNFALSDDSVNGKGEIVEVAVTPREQSENVQDVPIAITELSGERRREG